MKKWEQAKRFPAGKALFSFFLGKFVIPYTGTVSPLIEEVTPGRARVVLKDRRKVRNHLNCIHAIALLNVGEFTTGLAMTAQLPADARAIITELKMAYHLKARGRIIATCDCPPLDLTTTRDYQIQSELRDSSNQIVATCTATWRVGPKS
jgi:acyl-coenzyme A thioesterase PaaI-like protein